MTENILQWEKGPSPFSYSLHLEARHPLISVCTCERWIIFMPVDIVVHDLKYPLVRMLNRGV
jgi:hypothetical protein